jgi:hypothetical protein
MAQGAPAAAAPHRCYAAAAAGEKIPEATRSQLPVFVSGERMWARPTSAPWSKAMPSFAAAIR